MEPIPPLTDLISSLEQATLLAKHHPTDPNQTQLHHLFSSFQIAHHHLSTFLSRFHHPSLEHSHSSAAEPMQIGDDEEDPEEETEESSRIVIDKVEERLRNFVIQNKRRKRPLSPTWAAVEQRWGNEGSGHGVLMQPVFDPLGTRLRSLDLVFQFHG